MIKNTNNKLKLNYDGVILVEKERVITWDYSAKYGCSFNLSSERDYKLGKKYLNKVELSSSSFHGDGYWELALVDIKECQLNGKIYHQALVVIDKADGTSYLGGGFDYEVDDIYPVNEEGDFFEPEDIHDWDLDETKYILGCFPDFHESESADAFLQKLCKDIYDMPCE